MAGEVDDHEDWVDGDPIEREFLFGGETYDAGRDGSRLLAQLRKVTAYAADGEWHFLSEISTAVGAPEASVSARLRDLRKQKFGGHTVEREYVGGGLWRYRVFLRQTSAS